MELKNCPQCGAKAFIQRDAPDGFFMGYSVGCPRYKKDDGLHKNRMVFVNILTKEAAELVWETYVNSVIRRDNERSKSVS